mmetsp:Transcript_36099/g.90830  ORF Transcript_36099/g.90830 Transcript_36099/m.90830 type:complete len:740 (-) Transcript_36099:110-2329(-)
MPEAEKSAASGTSATWTCAVCTLENPLDGIVVCGGCGTARPEEVKEPEAEPKAALRERFEPAPKKEAQAGAKAAPVMITPKAGVPVMVTPRTITPPVRPLVPKQPTSVPPIVSHHGPSPAFQQLGGPVKVAPPVRRVAISNFSNELLAMGDKLMVEALQDSLSAFGELASRPSIITRASDGAKIVLATFRDGSSAKEAIAAASGLGFDMSLAETVASTPKALTPLSSQPASVFPQPAAFSTMTIFIDELEMPNRPDVKASPTDREVWVDPLPDEEELEEWLKAFGEVEEVGRVPNSEPGLPGEKGYVLFKDHETAKNCVDTRAGSWSESERSLSSQMSVRRSTVRTYPESIVSAFLGKKGEDINKLRKECGVWKLAVQGADLAPDPSRVNKVPEADAGPNAEIIKQRLHFYAEGTPESIERLKPELERRLSEIHTEIRDRIAEMGDDWKNEQEKQLSKFRGEARRGEGSDGGGHRGRRRGRGRWGNSDGVTGSVDDASNRERPDGGAGWSPRPDGSGCGWQAKNDGGAHWKTGPDQGRHESLSDVRSSYGRRSSRGDQEDFPPPSFEGWGDRRGSQDSGYDVGTARHELHGRGQDSSESRYGRSEGNYGHRDGHGLRDTYRQRDDYGRRDGYSQREGHAQHDDYPQHDGYGHRDGFGQRDGHSQHDGHAGYDSGGGYDPSTAPPPKRHRGHDASYSQAYSVPSGNGPIGAPSGGGRARPSARPTAAPHLDRRGGSRPRD